MKRSISTLAIVGSAALGLFLAPTGALADTDPGSSVSGSAVTQSDSEPPTESPLVPAAPADVPPGEKDPQKQELQEAETKKEEPQQGQSQQQGKTKQAEPKAEQTKNEEPTDGGDQVEQPASPLSITPVHASLTASSQVATSADTVTITPSAPCVGTAGVGGGPAQVVVSVIKPGESLSTEKTIDPATDGSWSYTFGPAGEALVLGTYSVSARCNGSETILYDFVGFRVLPSTTPPALSKLTLNADRIAPSDPVTVSGSGCIGADGTPGEVSLDYQKQGSDVGGEGHSVTADAHGDWTYTFKGRTKFPLRPGTHEVIAGCSLYQGGVWAGYSPAPFEVVEVAPTSSSATTSSAVSSVVSTMTPTTQPSASTSRTQPVEAPSGPALASTGAGVAPALAIAVVMLLVGGVIAHRARRRA